MSDDNINLGDLGNAGPMIAIGMVHAEASDKLHSAKSIIRAMCQQGDTHRAFLIELAMRCRFEQGNGIRRALEHYQRHLPSEWFRGGRLDSAVLLGFELITADSPARNIMWVIISEELGEHCGDEWLIDNGGSFVPKAEIRTLLTEGTHTAFLTEIGVRCEIGDEAGVRRTVEAYREHFPTWWFDANNQLKKGMLRGFLLGNEEHSSVFAIIAGELGANFGNEWFKDHFTEIRALFSDEEWAGAKVYARETFGYMAEGTED
jgi:hypothetical protein